MMMTGIQSSESTALSPVNFRQSVHKICKIVSRIIFNPLQNVRHVIKFPIY